MGTKNNPGKFDCYDKALPDEPMFILLARDPDFYRFVTKWAKNRVRQINCGERPSSDYDLVVEANLCANEGERWRRMNNDSKWRK